MNEQITIFVEEPSGNRYEATIPVDMVVRDIAEDFMFSLGWTKDRLNAEKGEIKVELIISDEDRTINIINVPLDNNLWDNKIVDGATIRISFSPTNQLNDSKSDLNFTIEALSKKRILIYHDPSRIFEAELTPATKIREVVRDFVESLGLPAGDDLRLMYVVEQDFETEGRRQSKRLRFDQTLLEAGIKEGDRLHIYSILNSTGILPVGSHEEDLIYKENDWIRIQLIYLPGSGSGKANQYWVWPELEISILLEKLLDINSTIRLTLPNSDTLSLYSKDNHHLIPGNFTVEEAKIEDDQVLMVGPTRVIAELLPYSDIIPELPSEIFLRGSKNALNYMRGIISGPPVAIPSDEPQLIDESKLIFVGAGDVGKTSLIKRLIDNEFNPNEPKTGGISIRNFYLNYDKRKIRLNVWDFGGQEIMHSIHRLFMTRRSIYVLVVNPRTDGQHGIEKELNYWLELINNFAPNSPIIVCVNKCETNPHYNIAKGTVKDHFPEIIDFLDTSCVLPKGIDELRYLIKKALDRIPYIKELIPPNYLVIKDALRNIEKDYLEFHEFWELCKEVDSNFTTEDTYTLASFLHDLGILLNFATSDYVQGTRVLNPSWLTEGAYRIINSEELLKKKGVISLKKVFKILQSDRFKHRMEADFIIEKMQQFGLCYKGKKGRSESYYFPNAFPKDKPKGFQWSKEATLRFQFHYSLLPHFLISNVIVRLHRYIKPNHYWHNGCIIMDEEEQLEALIESNVITDTIEIQIKGSGNKRSLLSFIRKVFEEIHEDFPKLKIDQMVPIEDTQEFVKYSVLKVYLEAGQEYYFDPNSKKQYLVKGLLEGIVIQEVDRLKELVAEDNLEEVFRLLDKISLDNDMRNSLIQLENTMANLRKDSMKGLLDSSEESLKRNRLTNSILEFIDELS